MNVLDFFNCKSNNTNISMLTCYDYWSARLLNQSKIMCLLVGDSLGMVMHGFDNTLPVETDVLALHVQAVRKGAPDKFIVADMPFMSFRKSLDKNMENVETLMKAGANAIKIEGATGNLDFVQHCVESGVPVMGHLGLTPQSIHSLGGFRVQGKALDDSEKIQKSALALENSGCFSLVLECVPAPLARKITESLKIPTIGIGAGPDTNGQVLVLHDMLGLNGNFKPKFLRQFFDGQKQVLQAVDDYHVAVSDKTFPNFEESYE